MKKAPEFVLKTRALGSGLLCRKQYSLSEFYDQIIEIFCGLILLQ